MKTIKLNSQVKYINPFEDEKGLTFTVIEISEHENWCRIQANLGWDINPTYTENLNELEII